MKHFIDSFQKYSKCYTYIYKNKYFKVRSLYARGEYDSAKRLFLFHIIQSENSNLLSWAFEEIELHKICYPHLSDQEIFQECLRQINPNKKKITHTRLGDFTYTEYYLYQVLNRKDYLIYFDEYDY